MSYSMMLNCRWLQPTALVSEIIEGFAQYLLLLVCFWFNFDNEIDKPLVSEIYFHKQTKNSAPCALLKF